jgi:hypothetical protein
MILEYLAFCDWQRKKTLKFECTNPTPMLIKFPSEYNFTEKRIRKPKLKKAG